MRLVEIYKSLSDQTRVRILFLLNQQPLCVGNLQRLLQTTQVNVSKHLAYLRKRGLVEARRQGQRMVYHLPQEPSRDLELQLRCLHDCALPEPIFQDDLSRLEALRSEAGHVVVAQAPSQRRPVGVSEPEDRPIWPTEGLVD